jgi:hypothetical protein
VFHRSTPPDFPNRVLGQQRVKILPCNQSPNGSKQRMSLISPLAIHLLESRQVDVEFPQRSAVFVMSSSFLKVFFLMPCQKELISGILIIICAALVDHSYNFECALHGCAPPVIAIDRNEKHRCDLKEKIEVTTTAEQILDVHQFWLLVDINVVSPLIDKSHNAGREDRQRADWGTSSLVDSKKQGWGDG